MEIERLGTQYGGWIVPKDCLTANSVVYSCGAGEDISFDLQLNSQYDCHVVIIDPTTRSKTHFEQVKQYYSNKLQFKFSGDIQKDYLSNISNLKPNFDKIQFIDTGVYNTVGNLKFYKQQNPNFVSQSLVSGGIFKAQNYDVVPVTTLNNIKRSLNHTQIDLLKMDIEGAEIDVLTDMLNNVIPLPKIVCVEFDLYIQRKDTSGKTMQIVNRMQTLGYKIIANEHYNITFTL